jgi:cell division septation protein DedD
MSDGTFTRPPRLFEPRMSDSRAPDPQMTDRRGPVSDPLLELARLIGQSDPFAPARGRDQSPGAGTERGGHDPMERAPPIRTPARGYPQVQDHYDADHWREDDRRYDAPSAPPRFPVQPAHPDPAPATGPGNTDYSRHAGFEYPVAPHQAPAGGGEPVNARGTAYVDPPAARHDPAFGPNDEYSGEYAEPSEYGHEDEYEYETEPEGEPRDDESGIKRRNTTKIVVAVLGLAVFGSAAAFGYRTIFKGGVQGPPPVIRADNSPTKAMPAGASGEAGLKPINERLGDGSTERMLRREEEPVELRDPARGANAGAVMPGGGGLFPGAGGFPPAASAPAAAGPTSLTDPKRVRTVTIRADQGAPASERAAPPPTRAAAAPRQAAPQSASQSGSTGAAPLAITPQAMGNAEPPPGRIPAAAPAASRATETGGFVVQLAAQKSEAEAQATFRAMQSKYSVLSGHHALIRRKDQGERGVFYASQVGPFGTKDEASQLCESLKTAGATCFVQRN